MYKYGEEISYDFDLLRVEDYDDLQPFTCGNKQLDNHIHNGIIKKNTIVDEDGLYFVMREKNKNTIVAVVSLAASGIICSMTNYTHVLPAIKIDVLAVDCKYQKMHYDIESERNFNPDEHYYFSDDIMGTIIKHCRCIAEEKAYVQYIVLYADKNAYRYYIRNGFHDFSEYMEQEHNQEINKNIPMYAAIE